MIKFTKNQKKAGAIVGTGLVIGLAGIKLLRSDEAKKMYKKVAAAGLSIKTAVVDKRKVSQDTKSNDE